MAVLRLAEVDDHWPLVFRGLATIQRRSPRDYPMSEIAEACRHRRAFLFVDPPVEGFVVLEPNVSDGRKWVHIWAAYRKGKGTAQHYIPQIQALARQIGAEYIEWQSHRSGYRRYLPNTQANSDHYRISVWAEAAAITR